MTVVQHRGHAIKAETVKLEFLQPITTIGEQEVHHLVLTIVKAQGIPSRMFMTVTWIEELVGIACQIT